MWLATTIRTCRPWECCGNQPKIGCFHPEICWCAAQSHQLLATLASFLCEKVQLNTCQVIAWSGGKKGTFDCLVVSPMVLHDLHVQLFGLFSFQGPRHLPNQPKIGCFHPEICWCAAQSHQLLATLASFLCEKVQLNTCQVIAWSGGKKGTFDCLVVSPMVLHVYVMRLVPHHSHHQAQYVNVWTQFHNVRSTSRCAQVPPALLGACQE